MKSALFGSTPSARKATRTPLPVEIRCAAVVWVRSSASGSSSGLLGSVGQTRFDTGPGAAFDGLSRFGLGALISLSGTTAATDGSAASAAASAAGTAVANAFATCSWRKSLPPWLLARATRGAWSPFVTCTRRPASAAVAGSSECWFFSSTITCWVGPDADGAGAASATPTSPRTPVDTAVAHTSARRRPARDTHPPRQNGNGRPEEVVAHANGPNSELIHRKCKGCLWGFLLVRVRIDSTDSAGRCGRIAARSRCSVR